MYNATTAATMTAMGSGVNSWNFEEQQQRILSTTFLNYQQQRNNSCDPSMDVCANADNDFHRNQIMPNFEQNKELLANNKNNQTPIKATTNASKANGNNIEPSNARQHVASISKHAGNHDDTRANLDIINEANNSSSTKVKNKQQ